MDTQELFRNEVKKLKGTKFWGIVGGRGTGSVISLSFGEMYPKEISSNNSSLSDAVRNNDSEYSLMVDCPWRIEDGEVVICGSHHSNEVDGPFQSTFERVVGTKVTSVYCNAPAYDLMLGLSNGIFIKIFCSSIGSDHQECYSFGTPLGWFSVFFDGQVKIE